MRRERLAHGFCRCSGAAALALLAEVGGNEAAAGEACATAAATADYRSRSRIVFVRPGVERCGGSLSVVLSQRSGSRWWIFSARSGQRPVARRNLQVQIPAGSSRKVGAIFDWASELEFSVRYQRRGVVVLGSLTSGCPERPFSSHV